MTDPMEPLLKRGRITFAGSAPMEVQETQDDSIVPSTPDQRDRFLRVGAVVREYLKETKSLLSGRFSNLQEFVPEYLSDPGRVLIACCAEGVVIRFEKNAGTSKIMTGWLHDELPKVAATLSQNLIQLHRDRAFQSTVDTTGTELAFATRDLATGQQRPLFSVKLGFDAVIESPDQLSPPRKPFCLLSIKNSLEITLVGEVVARHGAEGAKPFLATGPLRLPVGWDCIEVYPGWNDHLWNPDHVSFWAENDILALVVAHQDHEARLNSLDPRAAARQHYAVLLDRFKALLDSAPGHEETLQVFLRDNPAILCPAQTGMWPKLALGSNVSDFIFRDALGDYLLVELEKSTHRLFRQNGHPTSQLTTAMGQVTDWKRYLEDNLPTVQRELGLTGISANPPSLVVIGRSNDLSAENKRKLSAMESQHPRLRIMTYDDVYDHSMSVVENLLGPLLLGNGTTRIFFPRVE